MHSNLRRLVVAFSLLAAGAAFATPPQVERRWSGAFGIPDVDQQVNCAVRWRGGLVIGGMFDLAGTVRAQNIAWWDGTRWLDLGGTDGPVRCLTVVNDTLIVGGDFTRAGGLDTPGIVRWTGSRWLPMGEGLGGIYRAGAHAFATYNGSFIAVGSFSQSGLVPMQGAARWDGTAWRALGQGLGPEGGDLAAVYDGRLYVSGVFSSIEGVSCGGLAAWDGAHWTPVPWIAPSPYYNGISSLAVANDRLYVGGFFDKADTVTARNVAAWDGTRWAPADLLAGYGVTALAVHDDTLSASTSYGGIWQWVASQWLQRPSNLAPSFAASLLEDDAGAVITGAVAAYEPGTAALLGEGVLVRRGGEWAPLQVWSSAMRGFPASAYLRAIVRYRDDIVVAGSFESVADRGGWAHFDGLARWDGTRWRSFPGWPREYGGVSNLAVSGDTLVVIGSFYGSSGEVPGFLYDGAQWTSLDTLSSQLLCTAWFRGSLYAGSATISGNPGGVFRLDGTHWTRIASVTAAPNNGEVYALAVHDDRLVAGGAFDHIDGVPTGNVAAWDGTAWEALGALTEGGSYPPVVGLADVGDTLFAAGSFGPDYDAVVRWDDPTWTQIGPYGYASALTSFDGKLHAFIQRSTSGIQGLERWDGSSWSHLADINRFVATILPDGDDLWLVGGFSLIDGVPSSHIAKWERTSEGSQQAIALSPGVPNPTRGAVAFSYFLPTGGDVSLTVSDARGRHVATLDAGPRDPGAHSVQWDGRDRNGQRVPAGLYFVRLARAGEGETSRKVVLLP